MIVLSESATITAKKSYQCDASIYVRESISSAGFSISEFREIVRMKRKNWKIQPGQTYYKQVSKQNGDIVVFRADPEMLKLCEKYELFPDW